MQDIEAAAGDSHVYETQSPAFASALREARLFAADPEAKVLLIGETGTGKTLLARHLHSISPRAHAPFVHLNFATEVDELAGSSILGHKKGAYTSAYENRAGAFERGDRGTVFLDELGKSSRKAQQHLLHVIDTGEVQPIGSNRTIPTDCRVISASNVPLEDEVRAGNFLDDLHARLEMFTVELPPLRDRPEDIPGLVHLYVRRRWRARPLSARTPTVHRELMRSLERAQWPHNLRELAGVIHRLYVLADGASELTPDLCKGRLAFLRTDARALGSYSLEELQNLLRRHRTVKAVAAAIGFHRGSVHSRLRELGLVLRERIATAEDDEAEKPLFT